MGLSNETHKELNKSLIVIPMLLCGCMDRQPAPQVDVSALRAQLGEATSRAEAAEKARLALADAQGAKDAAENTRSSKTRAVLDETDIDLGMGLIDLAGLNIKLALAWYEHVQADPELQIWLANQRAAHEAGRADEVARNYDAAMADGKALSARVGALTEQVEQAKATESKARQEALEARNALAGEVEKHAQEIEDAKRIERDHIAAETRAAQVRMANTAGGICGVSALACIAGAIWLSAAAAKFLRGAALAGVLCVVCFGFARFAASPLFMPVTASVCGLLLAWWMAWEIRSAIKRREAEKVSADNAIVAEKIIPVLDNYYKHVASPEAIKDMDKTGGLWDALDDLGGAYDAAVKRIKAEQAENTVKQIKASIALEPTLK